MEKKAKEALDKENSDCNASLAENDSVGDESTAKEEGIKAPTIVECLEALATDPNVKRLTTDKVVEAADFFLNVGLVPLVPALRSSTGLHSWQILKGDAWEVEMATAATFIQEASALDNIIYNIKAGKDVTKKKREKMFTKTKMPEICMTYCKHRDEFKAIKEDPNLMRVMASWEKKCGIYREPEESSAKKRARLGPAPNEMSAPAKSECKQHVSNFFPTSLNMPSTQARLLTKICLPFLQDYSAMFRAMPALFTLYDTKPDLSTLSDDIDNSNPLQTAAI